MDTFNSHPAWSCDGGSAPHHPSNPLTAAAADSGDYSTTPTWAGRLRTAASAMQLAQQYVNGSRSFTTSTRKSEPTILEHASPADVAVVTARPSSLDDSDDAIDALFQRLQNAQSGEEYQRLARQLDVLEGNHRWKYDEESDECNMRLIRSRLDKLKAAHRAGDMPALVALVRSGLTRDLGGMCDVRLYQHTWAGTKILIEEYTEVVKYTLERIAAYCEAAPPLEVERVLVDMKAARQSFGNTGLMLSGGGTLGMCHIGVVKCLHEENLLPRVVCGSSAGSIVGAVLCCQKTEHISERLDELCSGDLAVFQGSDEIQGPAGVAFNLARGRCAFNIHNLCRVMKRLLGNVTFREAYNYSGRILNIHVSSRDKFNLPRLLNYQTAPNVVVWTAVASSCALPGVFEPPGLRAKDPETGEITHWGHHDHKWIDGSIEGDLPARTMERLFNVNNFIVSQVNPHVQPFLDGNEDTPLHTLSARSVFQQPVVKRGLRLAQASCVYALDGMMDRGFDWSLVKMGHAVLGQKYHGDITILPDISWVPWIKVLANPEADFMFRATRAGERATWPKVDRVRNHVAIELALNAAIKHIHSVRIGPAVLRRDSLQALHQQHAPHAALHHHHRRQPPRSLTSARSDHALALMWKRPGSSHGVPSGSVSGGGRLGVVPAPTPARPIPARRNTHRPTRSWYDPTHVPAFTAPAQPAASKSDQHLPPQHPDPTLLSSSDEARSGLSSPVTSYEDEDFRDVRAAASSTSRPETPRATPPTEHRKSMPEPRPFRSQPGSPTATFKTSYFSPNPVAAPPQQQESKQPSSTTMHLRRAMTALSTLQMTPHPPTPKLDANAPAERRKKARR